MDNTKDLTTFDEYELFTDSVAIYPNSNSDLEYPMLGLNGEAGEVADKLKKVIRGDYKLEGKKVDIVLELGDVFYYFTRICKTLNVKVKSTAFFKETFHEYTSYIHETCFKLKGLSYACAKLNYFAAKIGDLIVEEEINCIAMKNSLFDFLYYFTWCCLLLGVSLKEVINCNVSKLTHRYETDKVKGSGDHR